jgi:(1->4)-alpha-D-glucan 1-alpha-D-glucosylmutase
VRSELAEVCSGGEYEPIKVNGSHRDHVIAFARRRGREAVIVAVAKAFAPFSQAGRIWPHAENYDAALDVSGYSVEGFAEADATQLRVSDLFRHLPAAVIRATVVGASTPAKKRTRAYS